MQKKDLLRLCPGSQVRSFRSYSLKLPGDFCKQKVFNTQGSPSQGGLPRPLCSEAQPPPQNSIPLPAAFTVPHFRVGAGTSSGLRRAPCRCAALVMSSLPAPRGRQAVRHTFGRSPRLALPVSPRRLSRTSGGPGRPSTARDSATFYFWSRTHGEHPALRQES